MQRKPGRAKPPALGAYRDWRVRYLWRVLSGVRGLCRDRSFASGLVINRFLDALGFYRWVWHRALFDLAIYVILLGVVTAAGASILPLA